MNILLIGATGMVGSRILNEALSRGHTVTAAVRDPARLPAHPAVTPVALDVTSAAAVIPQAQAGDVIISAVSPRNSDDAVADALAFTEALIAVQKATGKRLLMVGGGSSLNMPDGSSALDDAPKAILPEATGMRRAYARLVAADTDFAVLAPGGTIAPGERTGSFRLSGRTMLTDDTGAPSHISAEDFAIAMLDEAETPRHFRTIFNVAY